jgi:hypothetical protein
MVSIRARDVLILGACVVTHLLYRFRRRTLLQYPPGPARWPIIGNTLIIPLTNAHRFYKDLSKKLGEFHWNSSRAPRAYPDVGSKILYLEALGQSIIVINDITIAQDLLEKRSALYSSRYVI